MIALSRTLAASLALLLIGCDSSGLKFDTVRVSRQAEAGNVFISTTFIAPWEDYATRLSNPFTLEPEEALTKVLPVTSAAEDVIIDALSVQLKANLAGPVTTGEEQTVLASDGTLTNTATETTTEEAPSLEAASAAAASPATSGATGRLKGAESPELGVDPFQQYASAKALHDEVQILNNFVKDAARRNNMKPYIARVQITVIPDARNQPYDTHLALSFFSERVCRKEKGKSDSFCRGEKPSEVGLKRERAVVVPLLITDNAERQASFRSRDTIRQLALAVAATQGSVAAGAGLDSKFERLQSLLASDQNSLLTVGSPTPGSLYVRLGAQSSATTPFATVPRNHNVTVLVMVPNDERDVPEISGGQEPQIGVGNDFSYKGTFSYREPVPKRVGGSEESSSDEIKDDKFYRVGVVDRLSIAGTVSLYDAGTGERLERDDSTKRATDIAALVNSRLGKPHKITDSDARGMMFDVFDHDYASFSEKLKDKGYGLQHGLSIDLWNEIIEMVGRSGYVGDRIDLPKRLNPAMPLSQNYMLADNGKSGVMTATLRGGHGLLADDLEAEIVFDTDKRRGLRLQAQSVEVGKGGRGVTVSFDSPAALGHTIKAETAKLKLRSRKIDTYDGYTTPTLTHDCKIDREEETSCYTGAILKPKAAQSEKAKTATPVRLVAPAPTISQKDGKGLALLRVVFPEKPPRPALARISVEGAALVSAKTQNQTAVPIGNDGTISTGASTALLLELVNLVPNTSVTVNAYGPKPNDKAVAAPVKFAVR